jgi:two-component system, NtrC family, sensor histidine kinase PilS
MRNTKLHVSGTFLNSAESFLATSKIATARDFSVHGLLRWLYLGRLTLTLGVLVAILVVWPEENTDATRIATVMFLASLGMTVASFWYTHVLERGAGQNFLYIHVVFDVALVTTIIHIMAGDPTFAPTYILVITEGALLLPLPGGMLIGALASISYFADQAWVNTLTIADTFQILLFALVALITGWLGDRVRRTGMRLGAVESELQQLRLDTGDILGNIATGVLTVDAQGRLAYMNRAAQELLGFAMDKWEGAPVLDAVSMVSPGLASILKRTINRREDSTRFKSLVRHGTRDITLGINTTVLEREHFEPSVTAIFEDITDLERLEMVRRRNERLEAVAELSASLAHEIKNPLASIRSSVEQMASGKLDSVDRDVLERLVLAESDRLSRLLSDFLDFSVMKLGTRETIDLSRVVCDGVAMAQQHPDAERGADVTLRGIDDPLLIPGDHDLLHRLVFNLVLNAVQFAGSDGWVRLTLEDCSAHPSPHGIEVASPIRLSIEDSGPGIEDEYMSRIFDPFYTTREGGSGLGLAVVHRAVEAHDGAVLVERGEVGGAKFIIYLPGDATSVSTQESATSE